MAKTNKAYYDAFSDVYERERDKGYHRFLDESEFDLLRPYIEARHVLEAGCGTGLILQRVETLAKKAKGVDISEGMLKLAKEKGLDVQQANLEALPFEDEAFDVVYSFKVLAHVERIERALLELARVTKQGGRLLLEFYNPTSLRGLIKRLKPKTQITNDTNDEEVFTRYDTLRDIENSLPANLRITDIHGIRIITPFALLHKAPLFGSLLRFGETTLAKTPAKYLAGFVIVVLEKHG